MGVHLPIGAQTLTHQGDEEAGASGHIGRAT
jgi:hypothetical protein